ncbi:MAG: RDD family protein [Planctomycetota bacterium]|nr:MAG: RDD family protein [Planctomycetota bacterium]
MSVKVGPVYETKDYAGFFRRSSAIVIDLFFLLVLYDVVVWGWYYFAPTVLVTQKSYIWIDIGWIIISFIYLIGLRFSVKGTLGYRIMRIRYAYILWEQPTLLTIAFRSLAAVVLLLFFALDHIWILFDKRKQAWHDKLSGFYVVKRKAQPIGEQEVVQRVINFMMLSFVVWEPADDKG